MSPSADRTFALAQSRLINARTRTAIIDHGNPGAWLGTTVACANDAEVLDGLLGALDSHEGG